MIISLFMVVSLTWIASTDTEMPKQLALEIEMLFTSPILQRAVIEIDPRKIVKRITKNAWANYALAMSYVGTLDTRAAYPMIKEQGRRI